ncbi:MAG: N-acetyltransferase [Eubacteriales bacterium]|nr:N-acetyltransferase [Eubacteriales bacterium]
MIIRCERPEEFPEIYDLVKVAFQTAKVSNGNEQDFTDELRAGSGYIPELALVAEEDGRLAGHIMFTKAHIVGDGGRFETLLLAPVSVVLEYRNKGAGSGLITEGFRRATGMGFESVLLVGDPAYYHRFGFVTAASFGIKPKNDIPEQYVMVRELVPDALCGVSGTADCF